MIQDPKFCSFEREIVSLCRIYPWYRGSGDDSKMLYIEPTSPLSGLKSGRTRLRGRLSLVRPRPEHRPYGMICRWEASRDINMDDRRMLGRI
jgi:hypothetical protein